AVVEREGDVYGDDVNVAARVEPLAQPGGVCVSAAVYKEVVGAVDATFVRLGRADLKNVSGRDLYAVYPKGDKRTGDIRARARFFARQGRVRRAFVIGVIGVLAGFAFWT